MAINQNHLFEELNGVKCAIVEKNVPAARVDFLRKVLEYNGYTVVVIATPPPKTAAGTGPAGGVGPAPAAPVAPAAGAGGAESPPPPAATATPETFTVGVTDVIFNATNAIFGRLLKAPGGHVVTLAYWKQQEAELDDERPYFAGK